MKAPSVAAVPNVWCTDIDLAALPTPALMAPDHVPAYDEVRVLVRLHGESLAFVRRPLVNGGLAVAELLEGLNELSEQARARLIAHLEMDGGPLHRRSGALPAGSGLPVTCRRPTDTGLTATVVICTRGRGDALRGCLASLQDMRTAGLDFVIVDNAPTDDLTARAFAAVVSEDDRFRYVVEPRPGLSCARNRGLAEATGEVIAFADDDVRVDPGWATALLLGFNCRSDVACVTSLVCTAALETAAEHYFDARVSWADRCDPRIYDATPPDDDPLYPYYSPGIFGTGAGMAFRTDVVRDLGGFDEALGAGTRTAGGEDLDAFVRILQAGYAIAYEPNSVVWHHHRSDLPGLRRQMYSYGTGLTAFFTKHLVETTTRRSLLRKLPQGLAKLGRLPRKTHGAVGSAPVPTRSLLLRELAGMAMGPALYGVARKNISTAALHSRSRLPTDEVILG